ncbi:MAG: tetratricopeptide repeat protein, partial [Chloroflexi bacterium]|nr:tetratricopeptide repeat protein [Chloroflexota bacterium]
TPEIFSRKPSFFSTISKRIKRFIIILFANGFVLGWVFGIASLFEYVPGPESAYSSLSVLLTTPIVLAVGFYGTILIHELGHIVGGKLAKFEFAFIAVGPFQISKTSDGLQLSYSGLKSSQIAGRAYSVPIDHDDLKSRYLIFIAGGPIATLIQFGLFLIIRLALQNSQIFFPWHILLSLFTIVPLIVLPMTVVPWKFNGNGSDGHKIWTLFKRKMDAEFLINSFILSSKSVIGTRARELELEFIEKQNSSAKDLNYKLFAALTKYYYMLDGDNVPAATAVLEQMLTVVQEAPDILLSPLIYMEAAYINAVHLHKPEIARSWLTLSQKGFKKKRGLQQRARLLRTEAAMLLAEENHEKAYTTAYSALKEIKGFYDKGDIIVEEALVNAIIEKSYREEFSPIKKTSVLKGVMPLLKAVIRAFVFFTILAFIAIVGVTVFSDYDYFAGTYYLSVGKNEQALASFNQGLLEAEREGEKRNLLSARGQLYVELEAFELAIADLDIVLSTFPDRANDYANRGIAHYKIGHDEMAISDLSNALEYEPSSRFVESIYFYRAYAYENLGMFELAEADYQQILLFSEDSETYNYAKEQIQALPSE